MTAMPHAVAHAPEAAVRLAHISKHFDGVAALTDVSVDFLPGEVHAILGENGAGKSTLMNIIAGVLQPNAGTITVGGHTSGGLTPDAAAARGIAISYQHPAILTDLSVIENLRIALPPAVFAGRTPAAVARDILDSVGLTLPLGLRCDALTVAQTQLLEIGKALALRPRLLILDEPTASLDQDMTALLFDRIREVVKAGTSVIYITHRLAELRQIADRVTVLRDGKVRGGGPVAEVSDDDLLRMIVGRTLGSTFPPKLAVVPPQSDLTARGLTGAGFRDVSFSVGRGEIVGIAGVAGNGQTALVRALAGLEPLTGDIRLGTQALTRAALQDRTAYMPADRHAEGLAGGLTIRENAALGALGRFSTAGVVNRSREVAAVGSAFASLAVRAPHMEAPVSALSGGNQQKIVMAKALLSEPGLLIADEPTQGVDVGARAEIYRILREVSAAGTPVIVNSSDAVELEGLCDKVLVMSRGRVVETLEGAGVTEDRIVAAAVKAATLAHAGESRVEGRRSAWRDFLQQDAAPAVPLLLVIVALAVFGYAQNPNFLGSFNLANILLLATALGFVAMGQTIALLLGAIDLSVGPLMGFLVIIASFFIVDGYTGAGLILGFALMAGAAVLVGLVNGVLIRFANFTAIAATLAMFIALQGFSFLLRDAPGGYITYDVVGWITWKLGPVPVAFLVMVALAILAEILLRRSRAGIALRALGSKEDSARRIGLRNDRIFILGFVASSLFAALGAIMLRARIGVGDPQQGANYTLASITAVVLGGTSLKGGRGTFIGSVLGAILVTEVLSMVTFLGLSQTFQYVFQGALILAAALIYAAARRQAGSG